MSVGDGHTVVGRRRERSSGPRSACEPILPGADPHAFEPTLADAERILSADLVSANGAGPEATVDRRLFQAGEDPRLAKQIVAALR